jgi:sugar (pentulose or hexulose) kinase
VISLQYRNEKGRFFFAVLSGIDICAASGRHIVGSGAKNEYLNALTQEATGKHVMALPMEATALGNLKVQMEGTL